MHDDELWQVYASNGQPVAGLGASRQSFEDDPSLLMGNAHVWIWRLVDGEYELLLQKRSLTRKLYPGMYHISVAGHINVNESPVDAAVREANEEMSIRIEATDLRFVRASWGGIHKESLNTVYIYEHNDADNFQYIDGEVESVKWVRLSEFSKMIEDPESFGLVPRSRAYFDDVIAAVASE